MKLVEKILVGLDLQPDAEVVLQVASVLARKLGSEVALVHVIPPVLSFPLPAEYGDMTTVVALAKKESAERLNEYKARLQGEGVCAVESATLEGVAFDRILAHADDLDANLILAGAGSTRAEKNTRLGITAERLCRKSFRPVWLVKSGSSVAPGSILCPVDFSEPSARALRNAIFLARKFETQLIVLTAVPPIATLFGWLGREQGAISADQKDRHRRAFDDFLTHFDFHQ